LRETIDTEEQGLLTRMLMKLERLTIGRLFEYHDRARVIYPHRKEGLAAALSIGSGCIVSSGVRIDCSGPIVIGERCMLSRGARIITHSHAYFSGVVEDITANHPVYAHPLKIGDNVFIGAEAVILPGVGEIGDSALIGIRAVVTGPVGPGEIWAGNPARKVGER
jgi:acetyltransferase-like isoleucine patch superfamily enzyme